MRLFGVPAKSAALVLLIIAMSIPARTDMLVVGGFSVLQPSRGLPAEWEPLTFKGIAQHTQYTLAVDEGMTVVKAHSKAAASGLIRRMEFDPHRFPWIQWRWKIDHTLQKGDATRKEGDDYAARIYVAFAFDAEGAGWAERVRHRTASLLAGQALPGSALTYIWANRIDRSTIIASPYTSQSMMIAVQSGNQAAGQWVAERRNLVTDYKAAFGKAPPGIIGIAIMTDTDNTGEETTAYYGDITLHAE
jgi:hypothetical protein